MPFFHLTELRQHCINPKSKKPYSERTLRRLLRELRVVAGTVLLSQEEAEKLYAFIFWRNSSLSDSNFLDEWDNGNILIREYLESEQTKEVFSRCSNVYSC